MEFIWNIISGIVNAGSFLMSPVFLFFGLLDSELRFIYILLFTILLMLPPVFLPKIRSLYGKILLFLTFAFLSEFFGFISFMFGVCLYNCPEPSEQIISPYLVVGSFFNTLPVFILILWITHHYKKLPKRKLIIFTGIFLFLIFLFAFVVNFVYQQQQKMEEQAYLQKQLQEPPQFSSDFSSYSGYDSNFYYPVEFGVIENYNTVVKVSGDITLDPQKVDKAILELPKRNRDGNIFFKENTEILHYKPDPLNSSHIVFEVQGENNVSNKILTIGVVKIKLKGGISPNTFGEIRVPVTGSLTFYTKEGKTFKETINYPAFLEVRVN